MVETEKEATTTTNAKNKTSLIDDEIGKDFFSSWKSMSMADDDPLDFNSGSLPKGKKSSFNFDKMDMDFSLDGDFSKISSFKVGIPDLDFSSPAKKPGKADKKTGKDSMNGKHKEKEDRFSFNFDFNALDSFDLDAPLMKGKKKADTAAESSHDMQLDSPSSNHEKNQGSRSNLAAGIDAFEGSETNKSHTLKSVTTTNSEHMIGRLANNDSCNDHPSMSANSGNSRECAASPDKETRCDTKVVSQCSQQSDRTFSTEPDVQKITQEVSSCSVSSDDLIQEAVPELQADIRSSGTEVNMTGDAEQDADVRPITGLKSNLLNSFNSERSLAMNITGPQSTSSEYEKKPENQNFLPMGDKNRIRSVQGDTVVEDAPIATVTQKIVHSKNLTKENNDSTSKRLLPPAQSELEAHQLVQNKENGISNIRSKLLNRTEDIESKSTTASTPNKLCSFNSNRNEIMPSSPLDERRRQGFGASDAQAGNLKASSSRLLDRAGPKGLPVILESEKSTKDHNAAGFRVQSASLIVTAPKTTPLPQKSIDPKLVAASITPVILESEKSTKDHNAAGFRVQSASLIVTAPKTKPLPQKSIDPKLVASSITPIRNSKNISLQRNEIPQKALKTLEKPVFKVPSSVTLKHSIPDTAVQREIKSLKTIEGDSKVGVNTAAKTVHTADVEKRGLLSPSLLKRKKSETSDPDPATSYPLKRMTDSPYANRKASESPEVSDRKLVHNTSMLDVPQAACYTELEVPLTVENDGIVEKAEACAKELEDICNMLKKKHEEAKEVLVRAIVNNNNLLMLNHPIYDEKIRMVQRFATRMMSRELQN